MSDTYERVAVELDELVEENRKAGMRMYNRWEKWEVEVLLKYWRKLTPEQRREYLIEKVFQGRHSYESCQSKYYKTPPGDRGDSRAEPSM